MEFQTVTYTSGLTFQASRDITAKDISELCEILSKDPFYEGVQFEPEKITEGGILFQYPDAKEGWYKSVRFRMNRKWPFFQEWESNDQVLHETTLWGHNQFTTYLKSFGGAPLFTVDELCVWEKAFSQLGCRRFGRMVGARRLKQQIFCRSKVSDS